ncbi:hemerythrin domain-containing protein [Maritalea mediterranea]|uniref:Hemerythrin domain-containing protein n=1 Tax=Maritalea mediterranea TaxID=2909667 RepID=A0ABS9EDH5_9HYPH|nr:hemerythrin domain-containing protein [Maritalea mediterranea]MCF4099929.1 hemerythrin domain-containing protein [Maritalea mediterranea]
MKTDRKSVRTEQKALTVLESFDAHQRQMEALCTRLELIADLLPDQADPTLCKFTSDGMVKTLSDAQSFEEEELFPILEALSLLDTDIGEIIKQLRDEHYEDLCFAEEVRDNLRAIINGEPTQTANATGYMLRGFFEKLRRHMAYERHLTSALRQKKTPDKSDAS